MSRWSDGIEQPVVRLTPRKNESYTAHLDMNEFQF